MISSEDQSPASTSPGDSMAMASGPELGSPTLRRPPHPSSPPLLTALQSVEPRHLPDGPFEEVVVGGVSGQEELSAGAGAVSTARGADACPQSDRDMSARRRLKFQAPADEAAVLSENDATVEDPLPGSAAGEQEMNVEELPESIHEDGRGGVIKAAAIPATAAGPFNLGEKSVCIACAAVYGALPATEHGAMLGCVYPLRRLCLALQEQAKQRGQSGGERIRCQVKQQQFQGQRRPRRGGSRK